MARKTLSIILAMVLAVSIMLPFTIWAAGVTITTDKEAYTINEKMVVTVSGNTSDWAFVSIYKKGARIDQYGPYEYVHSLIAGEWEVNAPREVGEYEIRVYDNDREEDSLLAKIPLQVKYITDKVATVKLDKEVYTPREGMVVVVEGVSEAQVQMNAYVSIYKKGARHDQYGAYEYIRNLIANKWEVEAPTEVGEYEVRLYASDGNYVDENLYVTVSFKVAYTTTQASVQLNKSNFAPYEKIIVTVSGVTEAQVQMNAYVSIYKKGARHDQYGAYEYIRNLIADKWEVEAPSDVGEYEIRVYAADGAYTDEALLVSVPFTVSGSPVEFYEGYEGMSGWAVGEVQEAVDNNLTTEKVLVEFQEPITREEFAELAIKLYERMTGKTAEPAPESTFTDTTNPEILKAYNLGIIKGVGDGKFAPADPVTRQEIATMLLRVVKAALPNLDTSVSSPIVFTDDYDIADWAREGINYFSAKGIIKGANGAFLPLANTTREAAIALIKRTFDSFSAM